MFSMSHVGRFFDAGAANHSMPPEALFDVGSYSHARSLSHVFEK